jgi:hypothetical protein
MTLLCAVLTDDCVLLSSDTKGTVYEDPTFWQPFPAMIPNDEKFLPTGMPSVMWGYSGYQAVAEPMIKWAKTRTWDSWPKLAEDARLQSAKAVRRAKQFVTARQGDTNSPNLLFGVLFVGYIGGTPGIVAIDHSGIPVGATDSDWERYTPTGFGGGVTLVIVSWNVLKGFHPDSTITTVEELAAFTNAICQSAAALGYPSDVWRVTSEGHEKVIGNAPKP